MNATREGVAIIGMACLFPGAPDVDAYWRNILNKVDATSDPPPTAWDADVYYDPTFADQDKVYCKRGGYLGSMVAFDPLPHGIPPVAVGGEPDQWLALQLAKDAIADAGYATIPEAVRQRTAVILGKGTYLNGGNAIVVEHGLIVGQTLEIIKRLHPEYGPEQIETLRREMKRALPTMGPETMPGLIPNVAVGRIANRLDLMGPTYTVDAACASSLVAVQLALRDLLAGECDLALVGGAQVWMPVPTLNVFCQLGALSRRQQIRPFDADADGTLLGEGIGMVVLKRLGEAERDGDRIYAVIKGAGVASDGRGSSVMAPRVEGEELALRRAYEAAGVSPSSIGLIEAHGTATPVGDVVEMQALARVFGQRGAALPHCALGTVKSMISHTIPAAGVAGMIKTALALHHKVLPPTLNCATPNPKLQIEQTPFYLNTETRPWIHGGDEPRRAGVNAFGFGGINAHVVLEEYTGRSLDRRAYPASTPSDTAIPEPAHMPPWESDVFLLRGDAPAALLEQVDRLLRFVDASQPVAREDGAEQAGAPNLKDLAFSVNCARPRPRLPYCLAVVASSPADLRQKLARAARRLADPNCRQIKDVSGIYYAAQPLGQEGKVAFLFPGEGAQYQNMLADLCLHFPEVRECFDRSDRIFTGHPRGYLPSDYIFPRPAFSDEERGWAERHLMQMDCAIEAVLSANQAVLTLLRRLGLRPDVCVGHSTGEYSAMAAAGILDLDGEEQQADFSRRLNRYYERMAAQDGVPRATLLAVGADRDQVEAIAREAGGEVYLAMDNCPHQAVLVGEQAAVERALAIVRREGLIYEQLGFDRAYHTPLFAPYADPLKEVFAEISVRPAHTPIYSCTTAAPYPADQAAIRSLIVEHWASAVEFRRAIGALHADGVRLFVEVGPRGNLSAFVEDILRRQPFCAVPANVQRRSGITQLNHLVGLLAAHGVDLDLAYLYERRQPRRIEWEETASAAPPPRSASKIALATGWPMLRLPDDIAQQMLTVQGAAGPVVSAPIGDDREAAPPLVASAATPSVAAQAPAGGGDSPPEGVGASWPFALAGVGSSELAPVDSTALPEQDRYGIPTAMDAYFGTMDQFLTVQQDIMEAYLLGPVRPDDAPGAPSADDAAYPLLGAIVTWQDGEHLVAQRTFDLAEDRYLRDHTLGRAVSRLDDKLTALAVMPFTMSMEMLAEAAACLLPEQVVVGMREVHAYRWLAWDDQPQVLQVTARRLLGGAGEDRVSVQLRNLTEDAQCATPPRNPVLEAIVVLASAYPAAPPAAPGLVGARSSCWSPADLYTEVMFHGPSWQGVAAIDETATGGTAATLRVLPVDGFFQGTSRPRFVLDPVTLDAAGQVIGFWTVEHLAQGNVIFPFRLERLDVYGPQRPEGEAVACAAAIQLVGEQQVRSNIDLVGADGALWLRLTGWEDKRFDLPDQFRPLMRASRQEAISADWPEPLAQLQHTAQFQCRRVAASFTADRAFWKQVWAQRILSRREREEFRRLRTPEHRQLEWLAGRTAAKEAVQNLLRAQYGLDLLPADIEILPDEQGCPRVGGGWQRSVAALPVVSLAHTRGVAVALAGLRQDADRDRPVLVGIDIEHVETPPDGFAGAAFDDREQQLLGELPPEMRDEWMLRFWCAKETVAKALGSGLVEGPRSATVTAVDVERGRVAVRPAGRLAEQHPDAASGIVAATSRHDDLVVAATLGERAQHWPAALPTAGALLPNDRRTGWK